MLFNILDFENIDFKSLSNEQLQDLFDKLKSLIDSGNEELKNKILDLIKDIDGSGSGLDADKLDGHDSSYFVKNDLSNVSNNTILNKLKQVDGSGSGLDADLLDGHDSSYFAKNDLSNISDTTILNKLKQVDGSGSGLDADKLDGLHASSFLRRDTSSSPSQDEQFDLGNATHRWKNVYATTFQGTTLQAENADLAEKYTCKDELEIGDVVCISNDEYFEIEKCNEIASHKVVGVYSYNPAFLMNKEKDGFAIALKGRVPVKVIGKVNKGDPLVSYKDGYAISVFNKELLKNIGFNPSFSVFAKALQSTNKEKDVIEVIIL